MLHHMLRAAVGGGGISYYDEVLSDSPVAWWRLEETAGSTVADDIGTNDGTVTGANLNVESFANTGSAASFDRVDDYIEFPNTADINAGSKFSLEALVKINDTSATVAHTIFDKAALSAGSNNQYLLWYDNRGGSQLLRAFIGSTGSSTNADFGGPSAAAALAEGCHVAVTFDQAASVSVRLYVNGSEVGASSTGTVTISDNSFPLRIGRPNSFTTHYLGGVIDEGAIYDKVLTPARILAHAQAAGLA